MTGPNMAGKSTYLKGRNALIAVLAQMGSFVARAARPYHGVVDRPVFARRRG